MLYLAEHSTPKSRETVLDSFKRIARAVRLSEWNVLPWSKLTNKETTIIRVRLLEEKFPRRGGKPTRLSPRTVKLTLSVLRGVLRKAFEIEQMSAEQYQRATIWPKLRAFSLPAGRMLEPEEIDALFVYCDQQADPYKALLRGIMAVLLGAGARREEVANLPVDALSGRNLRIMGKGRRERLMPLPRSPARDLDHWLRVRAELGVTVETMFIAIDGAGRVYNRPLSPWAVWSLVSTTCDEAGIEGITPHDFRRTFGSKLLATTDLATTQGLMGHATPATTAGYDRRGQKAAEKAVEALDEWWR